MTPLVCGTPAEEIVRLRTRPNPAAFLPGVTTGPVIGAIWDPIVDHTSFAPGALLAHVGICLAPEVLFAPGVGTVLGAGSIASASSPPGGPCSYACRMIAASTD